MKKFFSVLAGCVAALLVLGGCTAAQARADFHAAGLAALGAIRAAQAHPALAEEAKSLLVRAAEKADPADKEAIDHAAEHLTLGNAGKAADLLAPLVAASAPVGSGS